MNPQGNELQFHSQAESGFDGEISPKYEPPKLSAKNEGKYWQENCCAFQQQRPAVPSLPSFGFGVQKIFHFLLGLVE